MTKKKKIKGISLIAELQPELLHLTDKIARNYTLTNGKTALYWHIVATINDHIRNDNIKKLDK